jgi:hypothetical protein
VKSNSKNINKTTKKLPDVIPAISAMYNVDGSIDYNELDNMLRRQSEA